MPSTSFTLNSAFHYSQQFIDVCRDIALDCQHCAENELSYIVATMETGFIKKTQMEQMITSKDSRVKKFLEDLLQKHILLIPVPEAMEVRRIITHQWNIDYKKANPNTKRFRKAFPELWQRITDDWNSYFTDGKCDWCVLHEDDDSEPEEEEAVPPMYEATGSEGEPPAYEPSPSPEPEEQRKIFLAELEQHANEFWIDWNYEVAQGRHWQNEEWLGDFDDL